MRVQRNLSRTALSLSLCITMIQSGTSFELGVMRAAKRSSNQNSNDTHSAGLSGQNTPPTISPIASRVVPVNGYAIASFLVNDRESSASSLRVEAKSDNPAFVPDQRLQIESNNEERFLLASPLCF